MDRIEDLTNRLATLERSSRRHRLISGLLGCALLATIGIAATARQDVPEVLKTRRLEVLDAQGRLVLAADASERGGQLDIWNERGDNLVRIATNEFGGDWLMWNANGTPVISAYATPAGSDFMLWRGDGTIALAAQATADGGRVDAHAASGAAFYNLAAREGLAAMVMRNHEGKPAVRVQTAALGASVALMSEAEEPMLLARALEHGGELFLTKRGGQRVLSAGADRESGEGALVVADAQGRGRFIATGGGVAQWLDAEGRSILKAGAVGEEGRAGLQVLNSDAHAIVSLAASEHGEGRLNIADQDGTSVFSAESVHETGGSMALSNAAGTRLFAVGSREQGGLLNMMNARGVPIVMMGYAEETRGGGLSIRNGRGIRIFNVGTADQEHGELRLWDADGRRMRLLRPIE